MSRTVVIRKKSPVLQTLSVLIVSIKSFFTYLNIKFTSPFDKIKAFFCVPSLASDAGLRCSIWCRDAAARWRQAICSRGWWHGVAVHNKQQCCEEFNIKN